MKNFVSWINNLFVVSAISFILLVLIEITVRMTYSGTQPYSLKKWMQSHPKAFEGDIDFEKILKAFDGSCDHPPWLFENGLIYFDTDWSCGGETYQDNKRITLPEIKKWNQSIHVLGGSTAWGTGAIDEKTIPSLIQKSLLPNGVRVLNYGVSSVVAKQQSTILKNFKSDLKQGDIVVFYDGGNDFWNGVMMGNYDGTIVGYNVRNKSDIYKAKFKHWMRDNLSLYGLMSNIKHGRVRSDSCSVDVDETRMRVQIAAESYAQRINEAKQWTENLGMSFIHFYQPTLFDSKNKTVYENQIFSHDPCWQVAQLFKNDYDEAFLDISLHSIDLSNSLINKDVFFDYIHVSAKGNQLVVDMIIPYLKKYANN